MSALIPLLPFVLFFAWMIFVGGRRTHVCPDCKQPLAAFQSPFTKTKRQWVEGGYLCQNCGTEADLHGRKVAPGYALQPQGAAQRQTNFKQFSLLLLTITPAIVMLGLLLLR